jgi:hypothetical protein
MPSLDATPAYKGFRLQALYALFRILDDKENLVFEPEGKEDLSILDSNSNLKEVIQVKAYSKTLSMSSLKPNKPNSFFYRIRDLIVNNSAPPKVIIVSFGDVSELFYQALINRDEFKLDEFARDMITYNIVDNIDDAKYILDNISLTLLKEDELISLIYDKIKNIIVGLDPRYALSLLLNWIIYASEKKKKLNRSKILEEISDISRFLAEWKTHHEEWHRTIIPIINREIGIDEEKRLSSEFYHGFPANYSHILAKADVIRHKKLLEINEKFSKGNIVIIHAASGQGKTALAYRFLHDYFPDMWRFRIKLVESRTHALNIARALSGHANAIGVPIIVYLDVSARDLNWVDLVKDLSIYKNINILVTIREEDWKRSIVYYDIETNWSEIELSFSKKDAMLIFNSISRKRTSTHFLDFEDAWIRFGCEGPLMEFIYLITQGRSLKDKLMQQVRRLEDEVRDDNSKNSEIKLLRLVSIASAFEAQLKIKPLIEYLNLPTPRRTLELLEKEYLIIVDADESLVRGVHPIRSQILVSVLSSFINPWAEDAAVLLPMIYEPDIELFCFYAFSRCRTKIMPFLDALNKYKPERWISIIGITRALLWLGVYDYVELNRELILKAFDDSGNSFIFLLDPNIGEVGQDVDTDYIKALTEICFISEDRRKQILAIRSQQAKKDLVFVYAKKWLCEALSQPLRPINDDDWGSVAELLYWSKHMDLNCPPEKWINEFCADKIINNIPIDELSEVISALYYRYGAIFLPWLEINRPNLIKRFRNETRTISFVDDGKEININYIVNFEVSNELDNKSKDLIHEEASRNIHLLIKLFPDRDFYACQGYGDSIYDKALPFDSTKLRINRHDYIAIFKWPISLNAIFRGLCENLFRPKTWDEYANKVLNLRRDLVASLELLGLALTNYFPNRSPKKVYGALIDVNIWQNYIWKLSTAPLLPLCALDEWGYVSEFTADSSIQNGLVSLYNKDQITRNSLSIHKYRPYLRSYNNYTNNLWKFFVQSSHSMIYNHARRRHNPNSKFMRNLESDGVKPGFRRLSCANLATVLEILPAFQLWFNQLFSSFFDPTELDKFEKKEQIIFHKIWSSWYYFNFKPSLIIKNPLRELPEKMDSLSVSIISRS